MSKKIIITIYIILIIPIIYLSIYFSVNKDYIKDYNEGLYNLKKERNLTIFNLYEPYVALYNYGNGLFKTKDYAGASEQYLKALNHKMDIEIKCKVRINYVLSEIKQINEQEPEAIKKAKLQELMTFILDDNCAASSDKDGTGNGEGKGENEQAQELYEDMKEQENKLSDSMEPSDKSDQEQETPVPQKPEDSLDKEKTNKLDDKNEENDKLKQEQDRMNPGAPPGETIPYGPIDRIW